MTRDELIARTRQLIAEGERLETNPSLPALQTWLQLSDDLLASAWGSMDRYHLAWLMVGTPEGHRARPRDDDGGRGGVRARGRRSEERRRSAPASMRSTGSTCRSVGETGGVGPGQGMGAAPEDAAGRAVHRHPQLDTTSHKAIPTDPELAKRLEEARRDATEHDTHERRAPRPERMQR